MSLAPRMLMASGTGRIRHDPDLLMVCDRGGHWARPEPQELIPLPPESELFLLPGRRAAGYDPATGQIRPGGGLAVAAFAAPAYTLSAHPACFASEDAPVLPLFAYGAVGYARDRLWICASKVDEDQRQRFNGVKPGRIERGARQLLREYPQNRLVGHIINNCVRRYDCPAARNFALGRFEAPLPSSRACNARCLGCISLQEPDSPLKITPQCRLSFTPSSNELVEVMAIHEKRESKRPIYSFGQGCEGEPLHNAALLAESVAAFRALRAEGAGGGTVNCNSNASKPDAVRDLAEAGLTSLRVSLNSARPELYEAYYRPLDYNFHDVRQSIRIARSKGVFVSLNLLFFPGLTDTAGELEALATLCREDGVSMIQWRNLNADPRWLFERLTGRAGTRPSKALGLGRFMEELKRLCPWLAYGYFNPFLGEKAAINAPMPKN